ncbi:MULTISPECIES: serine hydrolase domain-containing protein [Paenibacillus]|uniref:CubicO group peptidase (Beta-lactamase class C family) n=1 Tax=Paenibacillus pabuli TaxID=1472 RepID=A0A855Y566_9BACL|nr:MULTISPECIES: serine hydrolase domain-containing protein [Paenibacillus]PWW45502.1 CubicO group peptidase (beta-lactamase class C family) [Paenibacillus pabuli]PXW11839.1 CubicO group peptidase (beta-lactamase class C family) [Paenibacillus taichungensis]
MQLNRGHHTVNKVIACILSFIFIIMAIAAPVHAEEEQVETTPSRIPLSKLEETIDAYVASYEKYTAAVSVVAIKDGKTIVNKAYGYADMENQRKADTSTVFEWASISKLLVYTSVMQLVEQGKLDLEADIQEYLPEGFFKKLKYDEPITLMNLMHHNAGWEDQTASEVYYYEENENVDLGETLRKNEPKQIYKPNSVVGYSNYSVGLAGYIVELVSGQPYYEYVNQHIFEPLHMNDTTVHPTGQDRPDIVQRRNEVEGYTKDLKRIPKNRVYVTFYPTGAAMGTAKDLGKFLAALMPVDDSHVLFAKRDTLDEMLSTSLYYDETSIPRFAHGFVEMEYVVPTLMHEGNLKGFSSKVVFDPASKFGMVVMTNIAFEEIYYYGLISKIFGNSTYVSSVTSEGGGYFQSARRAASRFTDLFRQLDITKFSKAELSSLYNVVEHNGVVEKISYTPYMDYLPVSNLKVNLIVISFIPVVLAILFSLSVLIGYLIRVLLYKRNKRGNPRIDFDKYYLAINFAGAVLPLNLLIIHTRLPSYPAYSSLRINLGSNLLYVVLAVAYLGLLIYKLWKNRYSKKQKVKYIMSGISAFILATFVVGWNLYV